MSRLILVFLAIILIVSFVHGQRFVTCKCTLVFFGLELTNVKLFRNEHEPVCNWELIRYRGGEGIGCSSPWGLLPNNRLMGMCR